MHVLIIDDNFDQRLLTIRVLTQEFPGLQIEEIVDRNSFEHALQEGGFDLTITDYRLRWSDGLEILRTLKSRYPDRPVIMFTDTGTQEIAVEAMKGGLDDYILKSPKHYIRLPAAVRSVLQQAETRLRANRLDTRLQSLLNQLNVGVFQATTNGELLEANNALLYILGVTSLAEARASEFAQMLSRSDVLSSNQPRERELRIDWGNRSPMWILLSETLTLIGSELVVEGLVEDITGRKRAETALKRYAQRLQTLQELDRSILQARSLPEIAQVALRATIQLIDCQLLDVTLFDPVQQQLTVLVGQSRAGIGLQSDTPIPVEEFGDIEVLQQNQVVTIADLTQHPDLSPLQQQLMAQGLRSLVRIPLITQGQLIGSLNLGTDQPGSLLEDDAAVAYEIANQLAIAIQQSRLRAEVQHYTEQLEQEVQRRTEELEEANQDLETFTYSVSHDLREPLRALQGYVQIFLEDYTEQLDQQGLLYAQRVGENARQMDKLLEDLLMYSRLGRIDLPLQRVDLTQLVEEVLTRLELEIQSRQAQIHVEIPLLPVVGHFMTLMQAITNLLTNAIKFVAQNESPQVRIWTEQRDRWVRLWVEDNGIGIEPQFHDRIFRVFERLHGSETYPGTGAGLAIVRRGIERMGGHTGVASTPGQGSRFWLELPSAPSETPLS